MTLKIFTAGEKLTAEDLNNQFEMIVNTNHVNTLNSLPQYTFSGNVVVNSAIIANGSMGSAGKVLVSNGSKPYWDYVSSLGATTVNTSSQYLWSNDHTFSDIVTFSNTTTFGNSTVNTIINSTSISTRDATILGNLIVSGTTTSINTISFTVSDPIVVLNSDHSGSPTDNVGFEVNRGTSTNAYFYFDETNDKWQANDNLKVTGTFEAGNSSITGFVNATSSVNSQVLSVGSNFIANTTGAYHSSLINTATFQVGTSFTANSSVVNAVSYIIGSNFTANTSGLYHTGTVNAASHTVGTSFTANSTVVNAVSYNIGTTLIANTLGVYHTGTVNAASHTVGTSFTANSTVVNAVAYNIGSSFIANTTGLYHTGTVNSLSMNSSTFTVGTAFTANSTVVNAVSYNISTALIANTTGLYHTGTINAASFTAGANFIANATNLYVAGNTQLGINATSGFLGIGRAPVANAAIAVNTHFSVDSSTQNFRTDHQINNTALTAARTYDGFLTTTTNLSEQRDVTGATQYNSNLYGNRTLVYNGSSVGTSDAFLSTLEGYRADLRNYAGGASSNTVTVARGVYSLVRTYSTGVIGTATGVQSTVQPAVANATLTGNITTAYAFSGTVGLNSANASIGTGTIFYGTYPASANVTTKYGIYLSGEANNYFSGNVTVIGSINDNGLVKVKHTTSSNVVVENGYSATVGYKYTIGSGTTVTIQSNAYLTIVG